MSNFNVNFSRPPSRLPTSTAGKIGASFFLLIFVAFGVGFTWLLSAGIAKTIAQRFWPAIDCTITQISIFDNGKPSNPNYRCTIIYKYAFGGHSYTGTTIRADYTGSSNYYDAQKLVDHYPVGSHVIGRVNPAHPQSATLEQSSSLLALVLVVPLMLVLLGLLGIYGVWKRGSLTAPTSTKKSKTSPSVFFFISLAVGVLVLVLWFIPMYSTIRRAKSWPKVPCEIVHSGVSRQSSRKGGTTYGVEVLYRYRFNGKDYASSRYRCVVTSSSGYASRDIVQTLPPRHKTFCYVDPADPEYALLNRDASPLFLGVIPLAFILVGGTGLAFTLRRSSGTSLANVRSVNLANASPLVQLLVSNGAAAFWNGIVSVFVAELVSGWKHGHPDYVAAVFMIPFVLVGLILIINIGYQFFRLLRSVVGNESLPRIGQANRPTEPVNKFRT